MPPRGSIILVDTVAIKGAHDLGCWNSLRKAYELHSVKKCIEEATRPNKHGSQLVGRSEGELAAELKLGSVNPLMRARRPQLIRDLPLVPLAAARQVFEEASHWLGTPLPGRYAARLAFQARRTYAHSDSFRAKLRRPGDDGRDTLYVFLRHWLAACLQEERPELYRHLPRSFDTGTAVPAAPSSAQLPPRSDRSRHGFHEVAWLTGQSQPF